MKYRKALGSAIARPNQPMPTASHRQANQIFGRPKSDLLNVRRSPESSSVTELTLRLDPYLKGAVETSRKPVVHRYRCGRRGPTSKTSNYLDS
jgi:hypothetical protein